MSDVVALFVIAPKTLGHAILYTPVHYCGSRYHDMSDLTFGRNDYECRQALNPNHLDLVSFF